MARTPVYAYDKTGKPIQGAYIENGRTYFGNGTPISVGTRVVDSSGREWVKTSGGGGELTGVNYGINPTPSGGSRKIGKTGAITASDYYTKALEEQQRAIQERINAAVEANNAYIPQIQQQARQALQNAYIAREQARVRTPQALNALGYTGGAAESTLLGLDTNYQNARTQIEQERSRALEGIRQNEAQIRATGDATLSEAAASYYDKLVAAALEAERRAQDQANWEAEFALRQKEYEDAAAQQAWKNAYEERLLALKLADAGKSSGSGSKTYGGMTVSQINDLVQSGVMSEDEARALLGFAVVAPTSSRNYNTVWANVQRALGGSNAGSQRAFDAAINYIQQSLRSGMITENEALQMLGRLNLL